MSLRLVNRCAPGGLSGPPLKPYALVALRTLRKHLPATIPIIGCGGISSGEDALEFARAGASLVQVYTAFGYDGVGTCRRIKDELSSLLQKQDTTWLEVVANASNIRSRNEDHDPLVTQFEKPEFKHQAEMKNEH